MKTQKMWQSFEKHPQYQEKLFSMTTRNIRVVVGLLSVLGGLFFLRLMGDPKMDSPKIFQ